jgi:hypothetical protein
MTQLDGPFCEWGDAQISNPNTAGLEICTLTAPVILLRCDEVTIPFPEFLLWDGKLRHVTQHHVYQ